MPCKNLDQKQIHLWAVDLDVAESSVSRLRQILATEELAKSDRFVFERDRKRYIVCRGVLRQLIGTYLDIAPQQVIFSYGKHGKPYLCQTINYANDLKFNISHSENLAVMAFVIGQEIGVDVEKNHDKLDTSSIAERFFSNYEVAQLQMLPQYLHQEAFFACWTRKEAFLKARGDGLYFSLQDFDVSVDPRKKPRLLAVQSAPEEVMRWQMHQIIPAPDYISTLAVEGGAKEVIFNKFNI